MSWSLLAIGAFTGWFAATAAILAIRDVGEQSGPLILSTAHLTGVLLTLWLIGRGIDEDRTSGFASAADATAPGPGGRLLGRWAGACLSGLVLSMLTGAVLGLPKGISPPDPAFLLYTSVLTIAVAGAWGVAVSAIWNGGGATLAVFLLWVLGHLPWGQTSLFQGIGGEILAALLPGPRHGGGGAATLGYTSAAVAGLLLITLASSRPAQS